MAITKPTIELRAPRIRIKQGPLEGWNPSQKVFDQMLTTTGIYIGDLQGNEIADLYNDTAPTIRDYIYWDYFQNPMTPDYNVSRLCYDLVRGVISMPAGRVELLYTGDYDPVLDAGDIVNEMEKLLDEVYKPSPNCCPMCGSAYSGGGDEPHSWTPATCEFTDSPEGAELDSGPWNCWDLPLNEFFEGEDRSECLPWSQPANWPIVPVGNELPGYHLPQRRLTHDFFFNNLGQFASRGSTHPDDWADRCMTRSNGLTYLTAGTTENQVRKALNKNHHLSKEEITKIMANLPGISPK